MASMAAITAPPPTSRYRAPLPRRQLPPVPPAWSSPGSAWREPPSLWRFVLLSLMLHALFIALFGAPSGGSREGRAMWGSMSVELRGLLIDTAKVPYVAPRSEQPQSETVEAPPAPARADRGASEGAVPLTPPAETQAAAVAPSGPAIVEVPTPFPPLLDRVRTEVRLDESPPLRVPPPTEGQDLRPPPRERPEAATPVEVPAPLPVNPATRPERVLADPPPIAAPVLQPIPAPAPAPAARSSVQEQVPLPPSTQPVDSQPVEIRTIPVPPLETLAAPRPATSPVEMSPLPDIRVAPAPAPALSERAVTPSPASRAEQEPARAPADLRGPAFPEGRRDLPGRRTDEPAGSYDPTAPPLDAEALRRRAGQLSREGSGQRALLPFPMPAVPAKKSQMETAIENARKPDCRTAYQGLGLAAIVPLIANEFGEGKCRW